MLKQLRCGNWVVRLAIGLIGPWLLTGCAMWSGGSVDRNHSPISFSDAEMENFGSKLRHLNGDAESAYKLGLHYQKKGKHHWAIEAFEKAVAIDHQHARYHNALGVSYDNLGDYAAAEKAYRRALAIDEEMGCVWNNLGYSAMLQGKPAEAVAHYQKALALDENNSLYRNNLERAEAQLPAGTAIAAQESRPAMTAEDKAATPHANPHLAVDRVENLQRPSASRPDSSEPETLSKVDHIRSSPPVEAKPTLPVVEGQPSPESDSDQGTPRTVTIITEEPARLISPDDVMEALAELGSDAQPAGPEAPDEDADPPPEKVKIVTVQTDGSAHGGFQFYIKPVLKSKAQPVGSKGSATVLSYAMPDTSPNHVPLIAASIRGPLQTDEELKREMVYAEGAYIKVVNGNGVSGMARMVGHFLTRQGFAVGPPANADHFGHSDTVLYFLPGHQQEAQSVAEAIPGHQEIKESTVMTDRRARIKLRIGRDIVQYREMFSQK